MERATSIDDYLASLDPFRSSYPLCPLPWPPRLGENAPQAVSAAFRALLPQILSILHRADVHYEGISLDRMRRGKKPPQNTICISVIDNDTTSWANVLKDIYGLFSTGEQSGLQVEIENVKRSRRSRNLPGPVGQRDKEAYDSIAPAISKYLVDNPHDAYLGFGCFQRKHPALPEIKPTVVLHIKEGSENIWEKVVSSLERIILPVGLFLEFRPALIEEKGMSKWFTRSDLRDNLSAKLFNGACIGVTGVIRFGTLGGTIILNSPAEKTDYLAGVTNHHVLLGGDGQADINPYHSGYSFDGTSLEADRVYERPVLEYRSQKWLEELKQKEEEAEDVRNASSYEAQIKNPEKLGPAQKLGYVLVSSGKRGNLSRMDCNANEHGPCVGCNSCVSDYNVLSPSPCGDYCCNEKHDSQDWAVFEISEDKMFVNKPPKVDKLLVPRGQKYSPPEVITEMAGMVNGSYVWKQGAGTKVTCGQIPTDKYTRLTNHTEKIDRSSGPPTVFKTSLSKCTAIIGIRYDRFPPYNAEPVRFSSKGDSGAWIIDFKGRVVGMIDSGLQDGSDAVDFPSSIQEVFDEISTKSGCSVYLPQPKIKSSAFPCRNTRHHAAPFDKSGPCNGGA